MTHARAILAGIFVGGRSSRMGSPKGLLPAPSGAPNLIAHAASIFAELRVPVVLVGQRPEYEGAPFRALPDHVAGIGPLGGLVALLEAAGDGYAIACACDLPHVDAALAQRLIDAPPCVALTPMAGGVRQPLFARYDAPAALAVARRRAEEAKRGGSPALQGLLDELSATPLALTSAEERRLTDWDTPDDINKR